MGAKAKSLQLVAKALGNAPLSPLLWRLALKPQLVYYLKSALHPFKKVVTGWQASDGGGVKRNDRL
jgi:hypothetical protein